MRLLSKLYDLVLMKLNQLPKLSLCHPRIKIDYKQRPYFLVGCAFSWRGEAIRELYVDDLKLKIDYYKNQFSTNDWGLIQYNLGGMESLQITDMYQIIEFDLEGKNLHVRNKSNFKQEVWDLVEVISHKKYLCLDKQSILELGIFYQKIKTSDIIQKNLQQEIEIQIKKNLYLDELDKPTNLGIVNHLKLVK